MELNGRRIRSFKLRNTIRGISARSMRTVRQCEKPMSLQVHWSESTLGVDIANALALDTPQVTFRHGASRELITISNCYIEDRYAHCSPHIIMDR